MSLRILGFILAAVVLVGYRVIKPRAQASDLSDRWNLSTLFLASALTLFAELALIRWVATEVRVFAYVKNLALLLCFLGFGLENLSLIIGMKALLLVAALLYSLAALGFLGLPARRGRSSISPDLSQL